MLEVSHLQKSYGQFEVIKPMSFTIGRGEIVGLLGHNGAGKTTMMKMISGYLEPNGGTLTLDGVDVRAQTKAAQKKLGYLPENLPLYPDMRVADYLEYASRMKGLDEQAQQAEIRRVIQATDIGAKLFAPIHTLSRGFKQRLGVAQALLGQPELLILDEPTNGLDPQQTAQMRDLIRHVAKTATVILSTHIMQEVEALCSRVLMVRSGELVVDRSLADIRQSNHILLHSTLLPEEHELLKTLVQVVQVESLAAPATGHYLYRLTLSESAKPKDVCARVAKLLVQNDHQVFEIQPERRDLESLFNEVNGEVLATREVHHAA